MSLRACAVVPHYNHERHLAGVLAALGRLPTVVVDDGSSPASVAAVRALVARQGNTVLECSAANHGKGAAVLRGLAIAHHLGYSHAVQVDADGQHRLSDVDAMLDLARDNPGALVSGLPLYDAGAPKARVRGRKISVFWVRVHTWSCDIEDPMCGFRVYPVDRTLALAHAEPPGRGMEFDIEIMVRAHWAGMPIVFLPTPVAYPAGGVSHFRMFRDNVRISAMHTRLFFGMLRRVPARLRRLAGGAPA